MTEMIPWSSIKSTGECPEQGHSIGVSRPLKTSAVSCKKQQKLFEYEARKNSQSFNSDGFAVPMEPAIPQPDYFDGEDPDFIEEEISEEAISIIKFSDEIQTDFVEPIDYRILCRFLGVTSVNNLKNHPFTDVPIITLMLMESTEKFMSSIGYEFAGELDFSEDGTPIPPTKNPWVIKEKELCFTIKGFQYYYKKDGEKGDNVAFYFFSRLAEGIASITCFGTKLDFCKKIICDLRDYTKHNNCLRGTKLQDLDTISAKFKEINVLEKHTWEHFYFPKEVKDLFELEVFGFLENVKQYNSYGIKKRGILLHGKPGCVISGTKIKIRKKKKEGKHEIINEY